MLLAACFAAAPLTACGNDSEKEIKNLTKEIEELQKKCDQLESELSEVRSTVDDVSETVDDHSSSIEDVKKLISALNDYIADLADAIVEEPTADKSGGDKKGGSDKKNNTSNGGADYDSSKVYPLTRGGSEDILYEASPIDDEEIAPEGDKVPDGYEPKPNYDYVVWLDVSEERDFVFNGKFVLVTMKIKEDAPDGVYPIVLDTDLSDIEANQIFPDAKVSGSICINSKAEPFDGNSTNDFVFYGDSVSCKPGDTVEFNINIANNPGLAAFRVSICYDSNAIEIEDMEAAGEFKKINKKL